MEQDILSLCRVCLKLRDNYFVPIFDENYFESQITIWETISEVFNVIVTMDDRLPQSICAECCNNITLAKNMKDLFEKTDIYLKNCLAIIPQVNIQIKEENSFWDENDDDKPKVQLSAVDISSMADPNDKQANKCSEKTVRKRSIKSKPTTLNNHICSYCGKIFRLPKSLRIHEQIHKNPKPFSCQLCQKKFSTKSNLNHHTICHTQNKPYSCDICFKMFNKSHSLKRHRILHGDKVLECCICVKKFSDQTQLDRHLKIHIGPKSFNCETCFKSYGRLSDLKRHQLNHTGLKPFHCSYCQKTFECRSKVLRHQRVHTGERPFECKFCFQRFPHKSKSFKIHVQKCSLKSQLTSDTYSDAVEALEQPVIY